MNKEQFDAILPIARSLSGVRYDSVRLSPEDRETTIRVYEAMTGRSVSRSERTCGSCILRISRTLWATLLADAKKFLPKGSSLNERGEVIMDEAEGRPAALAKKAKKAKKAMQ